YYVRMTKGLVTEDSYSWQPLHVPSVLWFSSSVLLLSSVTMEIARRKLRNEQYKRFNRWNTATFALGMMFLAGQLAGWRQLANQGIYLSSNAHSSFFYMLTCVHGLHLTGGLIGLVYIALRGYRFDFDRRLDGAVYATSVYWHFMDGLWIYLFVLLFFLG
ncbi:MAG TPA: cytochrome c oxidase subunit 3, partial [Blastocatellia bacterium]|nr:cytochrome c oxidase subunit 3 [Blastocatellia bacterium]